MLTLSEPQGSKADRTLVAGTRPNSAGFFGLSELREFNQNLIEPFASRFPTETAILDFSEVRVWDIAALLWLSVGLHYYKRQVGLSFLLRLPDGKSSASPSSRDALDRSADYLRRWRFDRALQNIDPDVNKLLVPEQQDYFRGPRRYFLAATAQTEEGLLQSLISRKLAEIRHLSDPTFTGSTPISPERITQCIKEFQAERIGDILTAQCQIEKRTADLFSDHLLTEALLNVKEHPNASIGMVAISTLGNGRKLVICVVDNGSSIPQTIFQAYAQQPSSATSPAHYDRQQTPLSERARIADFATKEGVTRKTGPEAEDAGMGLTYIKRDSVNTFGGQLMILTDSLRLTYESDAEAPPAAEEWPHAWPGNLLRISIPFKKAVVAREP